MASLAIGTVVGAGRWPYHHAHPDCWGKPWQGVVIPDDDPRAWTDTLAFSGVPTREQVRAHLDWIKREVDPHYPDEPERVPVLWDFGDGGYKVWWERVGADQYGVKPYGDDLRLWVESRNAEVGAMRQRRQAVA